MKTMAAAASVAVTLLAALPAVAAGDSIDFGSATCRDLVDTVHSTAEEDVGAMMLWLDGYLSGVSGDTVLDWRVFESFVGNVTDYCTDNPRENLLKAARKVGIE